MKFIEAMTISSVYAQIPLVCYFFMLSITYSNLSHLGCKGDKRLSPCPQDAHSLVGNRQNTSMTMQCIRCHRKHLDIQWKVHIVKTLKRGRKILLEVEFSFLFFFLRCFTSLFSHPFFDGSNPIPIELKEESQSDGGGLRLVRSLNLKTHMRGECLLQGISIIGVSFGQKLSFQH